jgi:hypothetical protein
MAMCAIYSHSNTPSLNYEDIANKFGIARRAMDDDYVGSAVGVACSIPADSYRAGGAS